MLVRNYVIPLVLAVLLLCGVVWKHVSFQSHSHIIQVNAYEQYELILQKPSPESMLTAFLSQIQAMRIFSGWTVLSAQYDGESGVATLTPSNGTVTSLITKAQMLKMSVRFSSKDAFVNFLTPLPKRSTPDSMSPIQKTIEIIMPRLKNFSIELGHKISNPVFQQQEIIISFTGLTPENLKAIAHRFDDLPVRVNLLSVTLKNGLFSGKLHVTVVGN